jgi:hypothetical protein
MKLLFMAPYPVDQSPSQRYRFEHYLPALKEENITFHYKPFLTKRPGAYFLNPVLHCGKDGV